MKRRALREKCSCDTQNEAQDALQKDLPQDRPKLIRKLRWIGLDDEGSRLQPAACRLPPDEREMVSAGPFSAD